MPGSRGYPKVAQLRTAEQLRARFEELGIALPLDDAVLSAESGSPLAEPLQIGDRLVGNRWCIHPMEGWDAERDGSPSPFTLRRWRHFGESGAKLIWGGEAAAVVPSGRANPNQSLATPANRGGLARLLAELNSAHQEQFGNCDDLLVGLQVTHSGRFCKPHDHSRGEPRIAFHHPLLDARFGIDMADQQVVLTDAEVWQLVDDYVTAAHAAHEVGFQFVDVKACHGYLLHEFLSARQRPGPFGGDLAGRSRLLCTIVERIRQELPRLLIGVRLSVFDFVPFEKGNGVGRPMPYEEFLPYEFAFGANPNDPLQPDLSEPLALMRMLFERGVVMFNLSCGSPYYNPHIQRPAIFPPSDGYLPPEDPLVGVARQIDIVRECKQALPHIPLVGTGYSYLQEFVPHVAQAAVREGYVDSVGLGRMVLSYPQLPADTLAGRPLQRKRICRTFSDCTSAPRAGLVSGCYPLDSHYKDLPENDVLAEFKLRSRQ